LNAQIEELTNQVKESQDIKEQNLELERDNDSIKTELVQLGSQNESVPGCCEKDTKIFPVDNDEMDEKKTADDM